MLNYFRFTAEAMFQIAILGFIGFILLRKNILNPEGLRGMSAFLIEAAFPALAFWQVVTRFNPGIFQGWWLLPLLSLGITALALSIGYVFGLSYREKRLRREFVCLVGFQNSGYLPLILFNWILPREEIGTMLVYLFLFLLGFNLVIWSWGAYFLSADKDVRFSFRSIFSPIVIAIILGLLFSALGISRFIPRLVLKPLELLGSCSFPLAIVVIGASLAQLYPQGKTEYKESIFRVMALKLLLLPALGLLCIYYFRPPYLLGLLILMELAVPSATSLALITKMNSQPERIISRGIFLSHLGSLATLPFFLAFYNWIVFNRKF